MTDSLDVHHCSALMSRIRGRDTKPELAVAFGLLGWRLVRGRDGD